MITVGLILQSRQRKNLRNNLFGSFQEIRRLLINAKSSSIHFSRIFQMFIPVFLQIILRRRIGNVYSGRVGRCVPKMTVFPIRPLRSKFIADRNPACSEQVGSPGNLIVAVKFRRRQEQVI